MQSKVWLYCCLTESGSTDYFVKVHLNQGDPIPERLVHLSKVYAKTKQHTNGGWPVYKYFEKGSGTHL